MSNDCPTRLYINPLFYVPLLGLGAASAGEVVLATRAPVGDETTINRDYFSEAAGTEDPREALPVGESPRCAR